MMSEMHAVVETPYKAMKSSPFSILEFWRGRWVFSGCFDSESEARAVWASYWSGLPNVLRERTEVLERRGLI